MTSKTSNIGSSPQWLSGPLCVELGGPTDDKFDACAHEWNWHPNHLRIICRANRKLTITRIRNKLFSIMLSPWTEEVEMRKLTYTPFCSHMCKGVIAPPHFFFHFWAQQTSFVCVYCFFWVNLMSYMCLCYYEVNTYGNGNRGCSYWNNPEVQ